MLLKIMQAQVGHHYLTRSIVDCANSNAEISVVCEEKNDDSVKDCTDTRMLDTLVCFFRSNGL